MIAYFGTGKLGAGFVKAFLRRGEQVQVWNRSPARARALEADGAKAFDDPVAAVRGAKRLHITLSDDAAVDETLERAREGFGRDLVIVDHTTTSPAGTAARAARWAERGIGFQHAPVMMGPQNALESTGLMLASGDRARFDVLAPDLSKMTGKLQYLGPQPERAASFKLLGNLFLLSVGGGLVDMLTLARGAGIKPEEVGTLFEVFNPGALVTRYFGRIVSGDYANPSFELGMARKDARLMMEEAARHGMTLSVIPAVAAEMDRWIAKGHSQDDWTVIARDVVGKT